MRRDVEHGDQHEGAPVRLRMRQDHSIAVPFPRRPPDDASAMIDQVEIEGPSAADKDRPAPGRALNLLQGPK